MNLGYTRYQEEPLDYYGTCFYPCEECGQEVQGYEMHEGLCPDCWKLKHKEAA